MNKVTMNVQEALGKSKLLEKKYEKALNERDFVTAAKSKDTKILGVPIEEWKSEQKARYDSLTDILNEINAIRCALNQSNAQTKVKIGDKEYTVAEAIYMKQKGVAYKKMLLKKLRENFDRINLFVTSKNEKTMQDAQNFVIQMYGGEKTSAANNTDPAQQIDIYYTNMKLDMIDPISILDKIKKLEKEIDDFETEVDNVLSVSNATTLIEVEF